MKEGHSRDVSFNGLHESQMTAVVKHVQIDLQTNPKPTYRSDKDINAYVSLMDSVQGASIEETKLKYEPEVQISQILNEISGVDQTFSIDIQTRNEDSNSVLMLTPHLAEYSTELNANSPMIA